MTLNHSIIDGVLNKIQTLPSTMAGWLFSALSATYAFFVPDARMLFYSMLIIVIIDAVTGVIVAIKKGEYAQSELLRDTGYKILFYTLWLLAVYVAEKAIGSDDTTVISVMVSFVIMSCVELISIATNALLMKPNLVFFRIMVKPLKGEIARKLGISVDDVEEAIEMSKDGDLKNVVNKFKKNE